MWAVKALIFMSNTTQCVNLLSDLFSYVVGPKGIWSQKDRSQSSSSSPSSPWLPSWSISGKKAWGRTTTACSSSALSPLLCCWWGCGWRISGTIQYCEKSTPDSFTYRNPGPTIHYTSATTTNLLDTNSVLINSSGWSLCIYVWKTKDLDESVFRNYCLF